LRSADDKGEGGDDCGDDAAATRSTFNIVNLAFDARGRAKVLPDRSSASQEIHIITIESQS
jgi:hypothetical protein